MLSDLVDLVLSNTGNINISQNPHRISPSWPNAFNIIFTNEAPHLKKVLRMAEKILAAADRIRQEYPETTLPAIRRGKKSDLAEFVEVISTNAHEKASALIDTMRPFTKELAENLLERVGPDCQTDGMLILDERWIIDCDGTDQVLFFDRNMLAFII
jgi:hypothetical protein